MKRIIDITLIIFLSGCIGTDIVDDPVVGEELTLTPASFSLLIGESREVEHTYLDQFGIERKVDLTWSIDNSDIASIENGIVTGLSVGQAEIRASFGEIESNSIIVTVIATAEDIAQVEISASKMEIDIGEMIDLMATVTNGIGEILEGHEVAWSSLDESILTVDDKGTATGVDFGITSVIAESEGVRSSPFMINVGGVSERIANLMGANGYDASGTARLYLNEDNVVILELGEDFETDFALGTFIYLSNSTEGPTVRAEGLELGEVTNGGRHEFNVSEIFSEVSLSDFRYIIVLCKPASITFGYGEFDS